MQSRRGFLKSSMLAGAGCLAATEAVAKKPAAKPDAGLNPLIYPMRPMKAELSRELTVAVVGAGGRGYGYQWYGKKYPGTMKIVAVADINQFRLDRMANAWNKPNGTTWCAGAHWPR